MNLPQLAKLLDDVRLCDISYGQAVLDYINAPLGNATYFHIEASGNELFIAFDSLPPAMRNTIRRLVLLTPDEALVVESDVACVRETRERINTRMDGKTSMWWFYIVAVFLGIAVAVVLKYIFYINSGGETIRSLVWDWLVWMFKGWNS